jgi:hypothetical protein
VWLAQALVPGALVPPPPPPPPPPDGDERGPACWDGPVPRGSMRYRVPAAKWGAAVRAAAAREIPRRRAEADAEDAAVAAAAALGADGARGSCSSSVSVPASTPPPPPPPWFACLAVTGGLRVPDEGAVLAAVNAELAACGRPAWPGATPPAPNALMPSDHVPLVAELAVVPEGGSRG